MKSKTHLCVSEPDAALRPKKLECIIAIDEEQELFPSIQQGTANTSKFGALRRAPRYRATGKDKATPRPASQNCPRQRPGTRVYQRTCSTIFFRVCGELIRSIAIQDAKVSKIDHLGGKLTLPIWPAVCVPSRIDLWEFQRAACFW